MRGSYRFLIFGVLILLKSTSFGQIQGYLNLPPEWGRTVYLSLVDDYRDMTTMLSSDLLGKTTLDSSGYFEFSKDYFNKETRLYRIHVSSEENDLEVYYADWSEDGVGYNYFIFEGNEQTQLTFTINETNELIFNWDQSEEYPWIIMDNYKRDYFSELISSGESAKEIFVKKYHKNLVDYSSGKSPMVRIMASFYLLDVTSNLDEDYLNSIQGYRDFFDELLEENIPEQHRLRLREEVELVFKESNQSTLLSYQKEIKILWGILFVLMLICLYFILKFYQLKRQLNPKIETPELTNQEEKILTLIREGKSNQEIADHLYISLSTVKTHINSIYKKSNVNSRKELMNS